jgi:hypothetical protein
MGQSSLDMGDPIHRIPGASKGPLLKKPRSLDETLSHGVQSDQDFNRIGQGMMRGFALAAAIAAAYPQLALAQEASDSKPMLLTVRPSGYQASKEDAQARQERLLKRLERSDHMVRSICVHCGDEWKHQIYAPFDPLASLGAGSRTTEETPD